MPSEAVLQKQRWAKDFPEQTESESSLPPDLPYKKY